MNISDPLLARADAAIADSIRLRAEVQQSLNVALARVGRLNAIMARPLVATPQPRLEQPSRSPRPFVIAVEGRSEMTGGFDEELERTWDRVKRTLQTPIALMTCHRIAGCPSPLERDRDAWHRCAIPKPM